MAKKSHTFKGQAKPYGQSGHFHEPMRHSLQARGIKTGNLSKKYNIMYGIGKAKYVVNFSDGTKTHSDGSEFFDMKIFKNKKDLSKFEKDLKSKGFLSDQDRDGVPDHKDCDPLDPNKQDEDVFIGDIYPDAPINNDEVVIFMPEDVNLRPDERTHATDFHRGNLDYKAETEGNRMYIYFLNSEEWLKDAEQKNFEIGDFTAVMRDVLYYDYGMGDKQIREIIGKSTIDFDDFADDPNKWKV